MSNFKNLIGNIYGRLTVLEISHQDKKKRYYWICACECGKKKVISGSHLQYGDTLSCGCYHRDLISSHKGSYGRLYMIWGNMKARCTNAKALNYHNYGGRGIKICTDWLNSFSVFQDWALSNGYTEFLTLDRKDNNGDYEPKNCRWITQKEQKYNTRRNILLSINGEILNTKQIFEKYGFKKKAIYYLLNKHLSHEKVADMIYNGKAS